MIGQVGRFWGGGVWLTRNLCRHFPLPVTAILAASVAGVGLSGAALGLVLYYLSALEQGLSLVILHMQWSAREPNLLIWVTVVAFVLLVAGFSLVFAAKRAIVDLACRFQVHIAGQVVSFFGGRVINPMDYAGPGRLASALNRLATADARQCGIAVRRLLSSVIPLCVTLVGLAVLSWLDVSATAFLAMIIILAMPVFYRINLAATRATKRFEALSQGLRGSGLDLVNRFALCTPNAGPEQLVETHDQAGTIRASAIAFRDRFVGLARAEYASQIILAVTVCALVLYLGNQALAERIPWTAVVAYLLVLRFTMGGFRQVFQGMATYARLFPSIHRLHYYFSRGTANGAGKPVSRRTLRVVGWRRGLFQHGRTVMLPPAGVIGMTAPLPATRYSASVYAQMLAGRRPDRFHRIIDRMTIAVPCAGDDCSVPHGCQDMEYVAATGTDGALPPVTLVEKKTLRDHTWLWNSVNGADRRLVVICDRSGPSARTSVPVHTHLVGSVDGVVVAAGDPEWLRLRWPKIKEILKEREQAVTGRSACRVQSHDLEDDL